MSRANGKVAAVVSRRRFLQAAAVIGGTGALSASVWNRVCADEPANAALLDRFHHATETLQSSDVLAIWVARSSVERGQALQINATTAFPLLDLWIHRVGSPSDAVWGCSRARVGTNLAITIAEVPADWPTGLYLISAQPSDGSDPVAFHPFVVTDQNSRASITVQVPFATYQAYNAWAPTGTPRRSLYDFNSTGPRAAAVAINRPYDGFDGAGFLFYGDQQLAEWLEGEGIDVNYTTSWDTHHRPELLDGTRLFVSNFHDEYWSRQMRSHFERRLQDGMNAAFFGANSIYWQVDLDDTTMACDKIDGGPHGTFRSVGRSEADLLGAQFESYRHPYGVVAANWVVTGSDHWAYADTGLDEGDVIERLVGYEWDRIPRDTPASGVSVLASSPVSETHRHHATIVERAGQGTVFNAGTNYWPRLLTGGGHWPANDAVQQITRNLLSTLG